MNRLAQAAIVLAAPSLVLAIGSGVKVAYQENLKQGCQIFLCSITCQNHFFYSANVLGNLVGAVCDKTNRQSHIANSIVFAAWSAHLLVSSACVYLALTSNPRFILPAVAAVLPLLKESYLDLIRSKADQISTQMFIAK